MSNTLDIHLFETGSGGDIFVLKDDIALSETLYQTIYLCLFGGNVEASTIGNEIPSQERFDYWGNSLFFKEQKNKQFNSLTEKTLNKTVLNSAGRLLIKSSVEQDLIDLKKIVNFDVSVSIIDFNSVRIAIFVTSLNNKVEKNIQFIWDNAKNEVIFEKTI